MLMIALSLFVQIYSNRELEDQLTKIREVLSDDKHDWEHRVLAVRLRNQMHPDTHTECKCMNPVMSLSVLCCSFPAEEGAFSDPGRGIRVRGFPSAAASPGGSPQTVR